MDNWNDDRIGELATDVKAGFARVEAQMKEGFARADQQIREVEGRSAARTDRLEDRLEKLQYWIWGIGGTLVVGLVACVTTVIGVPAVPG